MQNSNSDAELVKSFLEGDETAFNKLVAKYQGKIYLHARRMTGNHFDADEILQEVLIVMYNKLNTFEFKSSLYTWIYRIVSTRCINLIRKNKVRKFFSLEDSLKRRTDGYDPIVNLELKGKLNFIEKCLQKIPEKQREVFILRNYDELDYDEISKITGTSVGALKANYFHALKKIKEMSKDYES